MNRTQTIRRMRSHHFLYAAAAGVFISFWVSAFADEGTTTYVASGVVLFFTALVTWIGAIYVWAVARRYSKSSIFSLILLVPFGFVIGWIYVLVRARELARVRPATA